MHINIPITSKFSESTIVELFAYLVSHLLAFRNSNLSKWVQTAGKDFQMMTKVTSYNYKATTEDLSGSSL